MGYRLHYAKEYKVEWAGGFFNYGTDEFEELLENELLDSWSDEDKAEYEVSRQSLKAYLDKIKDKTGKNKYLTDYTNKEVYEELDEILKQSDQDIDYIRLSWY